MNICQVLTVGYISSVLFYVFGIFHKFLFENGEELAERGGRRKKWQAEERAETPRWGQRKQVDLLPPSLGKVPRMFRELATGEVQATWVS